MAARRRGADLAETAMPLATLDTPVGRLAIEEAEGAIVRTFWTDRPADDDTPLLTEARAQLRAYFDRRLRVFDLPLAPGGDAFQRAVCDAMRAIPYGETRTYGEIARDLGTYGQPVGAACGANPIPVVIPCHRVLSATGLGGYSGRGGVETKIALLKLEGGYPLLL